ncbi:tetratricopeptide repeat protein [Pseudanabaena biceps]|nr:tetratricopeptide repeat protein [Pseudanabaena biceps]
MTYRTIDVQATLQDSTVVEGSQFEHFLILQDPQGQQRICLNSKSYILGRSPEAGIVLRSQSVSREHATLKSINAPAPMSQAFQLSDGTDESGKSTNGLVINGQLRNAWVLMHGDEITFSSNTKALYRVLPDPPYANGKAGIFLELLHDLALKERKVGNYAAAENYLNQILALNQQLHGEAHPHVANCLMELGGLYYSQNLFDKAEDLFLKAISMRKDTLGEGHLDVAIAMTELAAIYNNQAMYEKAESMCLKALEIRQNLFGVAHLETAINLMDLAAIYASQNRYQKVKSLYERVLKIYKLSLEAGHPHILAIQKKLVSVKKKLRPKWISRSLLIPISLVMLSGAIVYSFVAPKTDISCIKVLPDGNVQSISGDECRRISK